MIGAKERRPTNTVSTCNQSRLPICEGCRIPDLHSVHNTELICSMCRYAFDSGRRYERESIPFHTGEDDSKWEAPGGHPGVMD